MSGGVSVGGGVSLFGKPVGTPLHSESGSWSSDLDSFQVDFNRDEFTKLIDAKGYRVTWERAAYCPNRRGASPQSHDINCTVCPDGRGFVYYNATPTKVFAQAIKLSEQFFGYGRWDVGSCMVTSMPDDRITYWDRLTLLDGEARFQELVLRQRVGDVDKPKYPILAMDYVAWMDRSGVLTTFVVGTDVQMDVDGNVQWLTSNRPDADSTYTMTYTFRPRLVVVDLVHQFRVSSVGANRLNFPVQAVAKMDFLVRDESRDAVPANNKDPFADR